MTERGDLGRRAAQLAHLYDAAVNGDPPGVFPDSTYERPNWRELVDALGEALEIITALNSQQPVGAGDRHERAALFVHGSAARSWEQVIKYLNGDPHDQSKVQVLVGGGFYGLILGEDALRQR